MHITSGLLAGVLAALLLCAATACAGDQDDAPPTERTTVAPESTTVASERTTVAPESTTVESERTTVAPESSSVAPERSTVYITEKGNVNWVLVGGVSGGAVLFLLVLAAVWRVLCCRTIQVQYRNAEDYRGGISKHLYRTPHVRGTDGPYSYDVFISHCAQDEPFAVSEVVPALERRSYRVCVGCRDWAQGSWPATETHRSVQSARRTLVLVSAAFVRDVWSSAELRHAHAAALAGAAPRLVVLLLDPPHAIDAAACGPDLAPYLAEGRHVHWDDPLLWDKLSYPLLCPRAFMYSAQSSTEGDD